MGAADVKAGGHILFAKYAASLEEGAEPWNSTSSRSLRA